MSRRSSLNNRYARRSNGPPGCLVFVIAVALVFGLYYLWVGLQGFLESGGLGIAEATERAAQVATATEGRRATRTAAREVLGNLTPRATATPVPPCQDFGVIVDIAIVRSAPTLASDVLDEVPRDTTVCVLGRADNNPESDWYLIDTNPRTNRVDPGYMREDLIQARIPTITPPPTVTDLPSPTPGQTSTPTQAATFTPPPTPAAPTSSPDPAAPPPTPTPTETPPIISA